jgi:hypothetical protein
MEDFKWEDLSDAEKWHLIAQVENKSNASLRI